MKIEETRGTQVVVLYTPPPKSPEDSRNVEERRTLTIIPPAVYVEYTKAGHAIEYRQGGRSWVC